jgi:uncharacterized protein (TIGR02598 family)
MRFSRLNCQSGFSLVEVVIALGVTAFCLLTLMGMLLVGINGNKTSVQQSAAANIAGAVMADLRATPLSNQSNYSTTEVLYSPRFQFVVPASGTGLQTVFVADDGTPQTTVNQNLTAAASATSTYRVDIVGPLRPATSQRQASSVYILITWPAQADPTAGTLPTHYAGSFQAVTFLNQN